MKKILATFLFFVLIFNLSLAFTNSDDSALILLDSTHTIIDENNKTVEEHYEKIKILNTRGREVFGDIKRRFNSEKQDFEIITAHTISPAGEIIEPVKSGISVVSAPEVGYATQYTNMQMQVVSFPALEPGAIIEYKYEISSKEAAEKPPSGKIIWQENHPVQKKKFKLTFPKTIKDKFRFVMRKSDNKPEVITGEESVTYSYEMNDIARIKNEANRPANIEISPVLYYCFNPNWLDVLKEYKDAFYRALEANNDLIGKVDMIVTGENDKIEQIVNYVKQDIRNVDLYFYKGVNEPNPAEKVLNNKYGTPQDKAVLLVSLLKTVGVSSYPVLVASHNIKDLKNELPLLGLFSYNLVAIPEKDEIIFVSPSHQFCQYGWLPYMFQDREAVALQPEENEFIHIPLSDASQSNSSTNLQAVIEESGKIKGEFRIAGSGYYDQKLRESLKFKNRHLQEIYFNDFVNSLRGGATLIDFSFTNPEFLQQNMAVTVEFEIPNYVTEQGERKKIAVPRPAVSAAKIENYTSSGSREYPLRFGPPRIVSYAFDLKLPVEYEAVYLPNAKLNFENIADFNITTEFQDNSLEFRMNYKYNKASIPAEKYDDFKQFQNGYFNQNNWLMLFK